jgi:hypothetical protein
MKPMGNWLVVAGAIAVVTGCNPANRAFNCENDGQCPGGACESEGFCSFPDPDCPSGRRFSDLSGGLSNQCVGEQPMVDAAVDAPPDVAIDARVCFGTTFPICLATAPTMPLNITANTKLDTSMAACAATTMAPDNICVVAATTITISAELRGIGNKPLVLLASESITVMDNGEIDVGNHRGDADLGAGANPTVCQAGTAPGNGGGDGAGGGAGGSFTGTGGVGGEGAGDGGGGGGDGGTPAQAVMNVTTLRGGCAGQQGADGGGAGGRGGGAVLLVAGTAITIGGSGINAGGEGGGGAPTGERGGGGGGSGGMIALDAQTITATAFLIANGGGGGEGSGQVEAGNPGADATETTAANGGANGSAVGGSGGTGSAGPAAGPGAIGLIGIILNGVDGGGGGGGGGAGLIKAPATATLGTLVSPLATP